MPSLKFSAWLNPWNGDSLGSFKDHASRLARVYPMWHYTSPSGVALRRPDVPEKSRAEVLQAARAHGVEVWPLVSNYNPARSAHDPDIMARVVNDPASRRVHIHSLLESALKDGAQGVDLDYEGLYDRDRDAFSAFVADLAGAAHGQSLSVGVIVRAKVGDAGEPGGSRAQDYAALAASCDRLQILGFGSAWAGAEPGPVAGPRWAGEALRYALSRVPAAKIEWGLPGFGRDWPEGAPGQGIQWGAWERLVHRHPPGRRDPESAELTLAYPGHHVWMNDAISLTAKLGMLRRHGVGEAALWSLGAEDPRLWALVETLPLDFTGASGEKHG